MVKGDMLAVFDRLRATAVEDLTAQEKRDFIMLELLFSESNEISYTDLTIIDHAENFKKLKRKQRDGQKVDTLRELKLMTLEIMDLLKEVKTYTDSDEEREVLNIINTKE